jgi:hypothetical protein
MGSRREFQKARFEASHARACPVRGIGKGVIVMVRFAMVFSLLALLCACQRETAPVAVDQAQLQPPDSAFLLPGDFSQQTSLADLQARFGKPNLRVVERAGEDNALLRSVVLFPDDPSRRAYVEFHDAEKLNGLASISVRDAGSRWRGKQGVHVGMSFADVRKRNGKPFYFAGFDSDGRGWIRDQWSPALSENDDRLGALDVGEGEHMYFGVDLGLVAQVKGAPAGTWPVDDSVSSDDPRYPRLGELVEVTAISAYTSLDDEWE